MKKYKITMYYVNGNYSYYEETKETIEQIVENYKKGLNANTMAVVGQEDKKFIVNSKNIILIQIEEIK